MKNVIPLIIAILLGSAAVYAVSRLIKPAGADEERQQEFVVAAARDISPDDGPIRESWLMKRKADRASLPANAILWSQMNKVVRQNTIRLISRGDYVLASDVSGVDIRLSGLVAEGEWAIPVSFSDTALVKFLQPGDEIAILGAYVQKEEKKRIDMSEKAEIKEIQAMSVIFPCVRILDIGNGDGVRRGEEGAGTIIVSLNPQQAMTLVAAQREMELYPALRRSNDASVRRRRDVGLVDENTFQHLKTGLDSVTIPDGGAAAK